MEGLGVGQVSSWEDLILGHDGKPGGQGGGWISSPGEREGGVG